MKIKEGGGMENPEKIEIEGLKTIHKLCKFGADHNMEGCTFAEIVERMFSKIEQMKTQVNTLDEMLLNQGEVLTQAKAQADQKIKLLLCDEHLKKCESPTGIFNSQYPDEEPCLICLAKEAKAQAVPEGFVLIEKAKLMQIIGSVSMIEPITRGNPYMDSVKRELTAITDVVKTVIKAQEPAND